MFCVSTTKSHLPLSSFFFSSLPYKITTGQTPITEAEGRALATKVKAVGYLECSATSQQGLIQVFEAAVQHVSLPLPRNNEKSKKCIVM
jgi:hypothetical protein